MFTGTNELYDAAASFNLVTFLSFMYLYYVEISRENKMIDYLEMNRELPKDNESVGEALVKLDESKQAELHSLDHKYQHAGRLSMGLFLINVVISAIPIINNRLDAKTFTVLLTNVLFIASKLMEVREIVNTPENVFYSAYLTERQQFNDVDPDVIEVKDLDEEKKEGEIAADDVVVAVDSESKKLLVEDSNV